MCQSNRIWRPMVWNIVGHTQLWKPLRAKMDGAGWERRKEGAVGALTMTKKGPGGGGMGGASSPLHFARNQFWCWRSLWLYTALLHQFAIIYCSGSPYSQETHLKARLIYSFWFASWLRQITTAHPTQKYGQWPTKALSDPKCLFHFPLWCLKSTESLPLGKERVSQTSTIWLCWSLFLPGLDHLFYYLFNMVFLNQLLFFLTEIILWRKETLYHYQEVKPIKLAINTLKITNTTVTL